MRFFCSILCLVIFCTNGIGQKRFKAEPDRIEIQKPASFELFYSYSDIINLTDSALQMRWVRIEETFDNEVSGTPLNPAGNWIFWMTDPANTYSPSFGVDSADFELKTIVVNSNKLIYQIFPNGEHGVSKTKFRVFPIDHPEDYADVFFKYIPTEVVSTEELNLTDDQVYFDQSSQALVISNQDNSPLNIVLYSSIGQKIFQVQVSAFSTEYFSIHHASGILVAQLERGGKMKSLRLWSGR